MDTDPGTGRKSSKSPSGIRRVLSLLGLEGNISVSTMGHSEAASETRAPLGGDPKKH